jgi:signal transduction histidine kinase
MSRCTIVCVDDEPMILESLKEQLKRSLHRYPIDIELAESGNEAIEIIDELAAEGIDVPLIISDQIMPGMRGDVLLIALHQQYPKMLKVMLTGQADAQAVGNAVNAANLYRYIAKPWDETDLVLTIKEALRRYEQDQQLAEQNRILQELNASLEQKVTDRTQALEKEVSDRKRAEVALKQAKEAAEAANRAKSEFLANMSHELRTPLNSILGFTQILNRDASIGNQQKQYLDIISRSSEHLLDLINDVLEMSKIEARRITLNENPFNLLNLLTALESMLRMKAEAKDLRFQFELAADLPMFIRGDESKLRQVLLNLLSNAIKFTHRGRVSLRVRCEGVEPTMLHCEVEDTGEGIAAEELDNIFEPFVQTESGRRASQGTGLGLSISHQFIKLMSGEIGVDSELHRGSCFRFSVPVKVVERAKIRVPQTQRRAIAIVPEDLGYRILVVDDKWENRCLLVEMMTALGLTVREAENGEEAIAIWQEWQPHLIWMDLRMPVLDGYEATQRIRALEQQQEGAQKTKIIAVTASALAGEESAIAAAGCDDFARKPFRETLLWDKMAEHLGVSYIYEDLPPESNSLPTQNSASSCSIEQMPPDWIAALHQAAKAGNDALIYDLIAKIPPEYDLLAKKLIDMADNFDFRKIKQLTQQPS